MIVSRLIASMTRRRILSLLAAQAVPIGYRNYSRCLPDYLRELAQKVYLARNRELAKLTNPAAIGARQKWVRQTLWTLVGGMPERTPLNARSFGIIERDGFRIEKFCTRVCRVFLFRRTCTFRPRASHPTRPSCFKWVTHIMARRRRDLSAVLSGACAAGISGSRFRPDGTRRAGLLSRLRAATDAPQILRRRTHHPGQANAPDRRHLREDAALGCDAKPGLPRGAPVS